MKYSFKFSETGYTYNFEEVLLSTFRIFDLKFFISKLEEQVKAGRQNCPGGNEN